MDILYSDDPIIACSTNNNTNSAIAVIRLSGFADLSFLDKFLDIKSDIIKPRYAHYCKIIHNGEFYDEVVLTYYCAPRSYNGENIIELSVHGNVINIDRIIHLFISESQFRYAYPGEFSYRALKNKKLSLSQIEGLDLLLNANSKFSLQQGFSLLSGNLQKNYNDLYQSFLRHKSALELSIDFLEDLGEEEANSLFFNSLNDLVLSITNLKSHAENTGLNIINPEIVLVGLPNAGKSSLFNILLNQNRAIVSDIAGTTRDYLGENIRIEDVLYRLLDTAGIRETSDSIEFQGIEKSLSLLNTSFYKILLINPFEFDLSFFSPLKDVVFDLVIFTHSDVAGFFNLSQEHIEQLNSIGFKLNPIIKNVSTIGPIEPILETGPMGANLTSKNSVSKLQSLVFKLVNKKYLETIKTEPILVNRHLEVIKQIFVLLNNYKDLSVIESDISILSSELNGIGHCISELIGIVSPDDVLHNIFNNFCIGK